MIERLTQQTIKRSMIKPSQHQIILLLIYVLPIGQRSRMEAPLLYEEFNLEQAQDPVKPCHYHVLMMMMMMTK